MRQQRVIRGINGDHVVVTITPDPMDEPLGHKPVDYVHIAVTDGSGDSMSYDLDSANNRIVDTRVVGMFSLAQARRLHAALGELLAAPKRRRRRSR